MAQISVEPLYDHDLARKVVDFLHGGNPSLFPFTEHMDAVRLAAFKRDLREGLSELLDSGSARKTSATGRIVSDRRLHEIVAEWRSAGGGWPAGADPDAFDTALAALEDADYEDDIALASAEIDDDANDWRTR